jgi:hypothetical protein
MGGASWHGKLANRTLTAQEHAGDAELRIRSESHLPGRMVIRAVSSTQESIFTANAAGQGGGAAACTSCGFMHIDSSSFVDNGLAQGVGGAVM